MIRQLTIIIPTLNEAEYLPRLLESIAAQTYRGALQVIVVDGRSSDKTVQLARTFVGRLADVQIIETNADIGHQRNVGARAARYPYLLFVDADVVLPPRLLECVLPRVKTDRPFIVSLMHRFEAMRPSDWLFFSLGCLCLAVFLALRLPTTNGDFMLTTRKNFDTVGGFKEGVILGEDIDFGQRSVRAGARRHFYFGPQVIGSLRRAHTMGRGRLLVLWARSFFRIMKHGPITAGQGLDDYTFGEHRSL